MSVATTTGEYRVIQLHLIDDPELAMRGSFDEDKLVDLARDIAANGLIQPIVVKPKGDRFEVIAGHRRRLALDMIGALEAPCVVRADADISPERLKVAENLEREDVNAADEAVFYSRLLANECGNDTNALAKMVRRSRDYVENRLLLLQGDPVVLDMVRAGRITFSVAHELNKFKTEVLRRDYLKHAIDGNASARTVREWRQAENRHVELQAVVGAQPSDGPAAAPIAGPSLNRCVCCQSDDDFHLMQLFYVHDGCYRSILRPVLEQLRGNGA